MAGVSVSFADLLRLMAELEGIEQTPENFHVLPDNKSMWNSIFANAREHSGLLCLEITGSWSPAARKAQPHFIRLAAKTNVPFLRVDIPQQKKSKVHDKVKETVGGVEAVPTYVILDFSSHMIKVEKFEGSDSLTKGEVEARLRQIVEEQNARQRAAARVAMLGGIFTMAFLAAELDEMKARMQRREEDRSNPQDSARAELIRQLKSMDLRTAPVSCLKTMLTRLNVSDAGCTTRQELIDLIEKVPDYSGEQKEWASSFHVTGGTAGGTGH